MIEDLQGKTAVLTGAGSGFGLELARLAAASGMNLVLADVQQDALDRAADELSATGVPVMPYRIDVSRADQMDAFGQAVFKRFGAPHLVFNNAGVASGGLVWESSVKDWEWVLGVNMWGVIHGVRIFTPMMLQAAGADKNWRGHIVNTSSMAGLVTLPNMGVYNVSKHAVVALSETLYQDLALVTDQVGCSVLCPFFVATGIFKSERNRPGDLSEPGHAETRSQMINRVMGEKAIASGKVTAAQVARKVLDAVRDGEFYVFSHPHALGAIDSRMKAILERRNPPDPFLARPEVGEQLRQAVRGATE